VRAGADVETEVFDLFRTVARRHATDQAVKEAALTLGLSPLLDMPEDDFADGTPEQRAGQAIVSLLVAAQRAGAVRPDVGLADLWALVVGTPAAGTPDDVRDRYIEIVIAGLRRTR
jgi:hypothetical protein